MTDSTMTAPAGPDGKLDKDTLSHLRRNHGFELEVPGTALHHVRRGLHLALKVAAEQLATKAGGAAEAAGNRFATIAPGYTGALKHLDDVRGALGRIGWDAGGSRAPEDDVSLDLSDEIDLSVFYEAIVLASGDPSHGQSASAELGVCSTSSTPRSSLPTSLTRSGKAGHVRALRPLARDGSTPRATPPSA